MKPYTLKMQAFGPYLKYTECDFSLLFNSKIFLISGKTGSGKTAILDAMCFALYGESTGAARRLTDMRSTAAEDNLPTILEFEFAMGEKLYKFERELRVRHKRSGGTDEVQSAACSHWDGERWRLITSGTAAVNAEAKNILAFDSEQFSQVVVLPQGEFKKLLMAGGKEKTEILQVLFSARKWQDIQRRLSVNERTLAAELKELNVGLSTLYQAAEAADENDLRGKLTKAEEAVKQGEKAANEQKNLLELAYKNHEEATITEKKFAELEQAKKQAAEDEASKTEFQNQKNNIDFLRKMLNIAPLFQHQKSDLIHKNKAEQDLIAAKNALESTKIKLQDAKNSALEIPSLSEKEREYSTLAAKMEDALPAVIGLEASQKSAVKINEQIDFLSKNINKITGEITELDARLSKGDEYVNTEQKRLFDEYPQWLERRARLKEALENHTLLNKALKSSADFAASEAAEKSTYDALTAEYNAAAEKLRIAREQINENMAYTLSRALAEGEPCPVCGSAHHPSPALPANEIISSENIEDLEQELKNITAKREKAGVSAASAATRAAEAAEKLIEIKTLLKDEVSQEELSNQLEQVNTSIAETERFRVNFEKYKEKLAAFRNEKSLKSAEMENSRNTLGELQNTLTALNAEIAQSLERAGNIPPGDFRKKLSETKKSAEELTQRIISINEVLNAQNIAYSAALEREKSAAENFTRASENYEKSCEAFKFAVNTAKIPDTADFDSFTHKSEDIEKMSADLEEKNRRIEANVRRLSELQELLRDTSRPDTVKSAAELSERQNIANEINKNLGTISNIFKNLQGTAAETARLIAENARIHEKYQKVKRISDLLSGGAGNPRKINIESFVLGLMLDEVVSAASRYLLRLSRGRYALVRADGTDRRMRSGLEIEVTDAHLGAQRRVSTLSGGELFLASLSLAFGLSEVVQSYAGGVRLDSIFIDEGFGSLDNEMLDCAMQALDEIRSEGRLVGVISHVSELKERILSRIEVENGELTVIPQ